MFVEVLARLVIKVYAVSHLNGLFVLSLHKQRHGFLSVLHTAGSIEPWAELEHYVVHGYFLVGKPAYFYYCLEPGGRIAVNSPKPVIGKNAVLAGYRHYVACYAHRAKVEQREQLVELYSVIERKRLHEFEAHAAARQVGKRISGVLTLGV